MVHSSEGPKPGAIAPQHDEHAVCVIPVLEAVPVRNLDWDHLIAGGQTPCLPLGAERRNEPRK